MTAREELKYLLEKHLDNQLSEEETSRMGVLLHKNDHRTLIADIIEEILAEKRYAAVPDMDKDFLFDSVMKKANHRSPVVTMKRVAYAASLLLVLGAAAWLVLQEKTPLQKTVQTASVPDQPTDKVVLTLANGTKIVLNDEKTVNEKSGIAIIQTTNGEIAYKVTGARAGDAGYNTITTPKGGRSLIILPDNSRVWLNAASSLKFPVSFTNDTRTVFLDGEGYFEVTKDKARPFAVQARDVQVNVLGTHFNVMAYADEATIKTTLVEGSVKLINKKTQTLLKPGEQGTLSGNGETFHISQPNMMQVLSWKNDEYRFDETNIAVIMRQLTRWYDLSVVYEGNLSNVTLSGVISKRQKVRELLEILETTHKVQFKMEGNKITVMPYPIQ